MDNKRKTDLLVGFSFWWERTDSLLRLSKAPPEPSPKLAARVPRRVWRSLRIRPFRLSDKTKKQNYDSYGDENGPQGFGGFGSGGFSGFGGFGGADFGDFGDIFSNIFGGTFGGGRSSRRASAQAQGADIQVKMTLSFVEAAFGVKKNINLNRSETCPHC